ncbi:hypothetical protein [Microcoleus sp. F4-D5]|uniref:hypothetical protein n=1 Tax=Microcoleus sp. F4-D5 TaxID=2818760 RepID=UPI002FD28771
MQFITHQKLTQYPLGLFFPSVSQISLKLYKDVVIHRCLFESVKCDRERRGVGREKCDRTDSIQKKILNSFDISTQVKL